MAILISPGPRPKTWQLSTWRCPAWPPTAKVRRGWCGQTYRRTPRRMSTPNLAEYSGMVMLRSNSALQPTRRLPNRNMPRLHRGPSRICLSVSAHLDSYKPAASVSISGFAPRTLRGWTCVACLRRGVGIAEASRIRQLRSKTAACLAVPLTLSLYMAAAICGRAAAWGRGGSSRI